jgi:DHA3 family macrolide efflux protein-like MFS transporter
MSLIGSMATAVTPLSLAIAGPVSDLAGIRSWFIFAGVVCILTGVSGFFIPTVMQIETQKNQPVIKIVENS